MSEDTWQDSLKSWAEERSDIAAVVQIGSRVQADTVADEWSDYDYHLVSKSPAKYLDGSAVSQISSCWICSSQKTFGGVTKVSAVFEDALEADFVVLKAFEIKMAAILCRKPFLFNLLPLPLKQGIFDLRRVAGRGFKVIKGGKPWHDRYMQFQPYRAPFQHEEFAAICREFWSQLIWGTKKIERGELLAAQRAFHLVLVELTMKLLEEEAQLDGRHPNPLSRRAENWLPANRLKSISIESRLERSSLRNAYNDIQSIFLEVSASICRSLKWQVVGAESAIIWRKKLAERNSL